ncbi:uncharacterized protein LOC127877663 isoform X1 [Dreissena polymorpha]|uniref:Uncharacterized protein n=1 Tax=Dreissena polymorpha TaxID=45954 RepID=A0A9D4KBA4_DREPO|nr:uncharacterized protein LOC127877663 isoform X1 [Dreissena polymorpha]KAH3836630.1 hypothetical protein DPMN_110001 [Dreissena polymorpha]
MSAHILQCTFGISFAFCFFLGGGEAFDNGPRITGVRFLITVNDTWAEPPGCITTVATPMIAPNLPYNKSQSILVGDCDRGPIQYTYTTPGKDGNKFTVDLTFYSSVIEDASPPTCSLSWNGTYLVPKPSDNSLPDLLPACFTMDSREGYHMTYYWFHILDWRIE